MHYTCLKQLSGWNVVIALHSVHYVTIFIDIFQQNLL